jgi:hypothetical protein
MIYRILFVLSFRVINEYLLLTKPRYPSFQDDLTSVSIAIVAIDSLHFDPFFEVIRTLNKYIIHNIYNSDRYYLFQKLEVPIFYIKKSFEKLLKYYLLNTLYITTNSAAILHFILHYCHSS